MMTPSTRPIPRAQGMFGVAAILLMAAALAIAPISAGHAANPPEPADPDQPMTVDLIDGTVVVVDVGTLNQLYAAVAQPSDAAASAALLQVLNSSTYPTAVLLVAAYRLNPNRTAAIAAAAAQSNRQDKQAALELFSYEPGVDLLQLVAGVQSIDPDLARMLADFIAANLPQNARPAERQTTLARETAENPNQISPKTPEQQQQQQQQPQVQ